MSNNNLNQVIENLRQPESTIHKTKIQAYTPNQVNRLSGLRERPSYEELIEYIVTDPEKK